MNTHNIPTDRKKILEPETKPIGTGKVCFIYIQSSTYLLSRGKRSRLIWLSRFDPNPINIVYKLLENIYYLSLLGRRAWWQCISFPRELVRARWGRWQRAFRRQKLSEMSQKKHSPQQSKYLLLSLTSWPGRRCVALSKLNLDLVLRSLSQTPDKLSRYH